MDEFIEVEGAASIKERLVEHRASLMLHVRAPDAERAIAQALDLRNECIRALIDAGMQESELSEGGAEVWRTWWWKKRKVGQDASHKILVACSDVTRLYTALGALEPLFQNKRYSLNVSMMSPTFEFPEDAKANCQRDAVENARSKASILAGAAALQLGRVLQIEELAPTRNRSGAYGDEDWGYPVAVAAGPAAAAAEPVELESAQREHTMKYRVRFSVDPL